MTDVPIDGQMLSGFTPHPPRDSSTEIILCKIYVRNMVWGVIMVTTSTIRGNGTKSFTNVNTDPQITHDIEVGHEAVSEGNVVSLVFIFLGRYIGQIYFA